MDVGIAGVGKMGAAIAQRLMDVGHKVTVWNRSADKTRPLADAGAAVAATPAELAAQSETIITILTDAAAIDAVYSGPSGLLSGDVKGKLFIEMSTVQPATEVALAAKVRAKGAAFVECPVGGTTGPARQGKLIGLVGAEAADAARAKPLLEQLCRRIEHCGPVGQRRDHEVHHQHAADDLLAGARRGACAVAAARTRSRARDGSAVRHLRRAQRPEGARAGDRQGAQERRSTARSRSPSPTD